MIIDRKKLLDSISKVLPGIDQKGLVEQMTNLHFTTKSIVTYNDSIYCRLPFPTDFACAVHATTLYNLLKGISGEKVKVELVNNSLKLNAVGVAADLNIGEGTEINDILNGIDKEIKELKNIEPLPSDFINGVNLCAFSAFVKDVGGSFTCIKVAGKHMMSSDKTRFSLYEMSTTMPEIMFKATTALSMVKYDLKLMSETKSWLHFFEAKDGLVFSVRKYSGEYPVAEITAMVGAIKPTSKITIPEEVLSALGFLNVFTEGQEQKHTQITVKDNFMTLQVKGTKGTVTKKMKVESKQNFTFGINPSLLGEILKRGIRTIELSNVDKTKPPMAFFRLKNFTHAIALFI
jgi:hypothetical protein